MVIFTGTNVYLFVYKEQEALQLCFSFKQIQVFLPRLIVLRNVRFVRHLNMEIDGNLCVPLTNRSLGLRELTLALRIIY